MRNGLREKSLTQEHSTMPPAPTAPVCTQHCGARLLQNCPPSTSSSSSLVRRGEAKQRQGQWMERYCTKPWPAPTGTPSPLPKLLSHHLSAMSSLLPPPSPHTQRPRIHPAPILVTVVLVPSP